MVVEISKEQKAALAEKVALCVAFIQDTVQPHLVDGDTVSVVVSDTLELLISNKSMSVCIYNRMDLYVTVLTLKKTACLVEAEKTKKKKFLCEDYPELAVEFLKNWEKTKAYLEKQVADKNKKVDDLNNFVTSFQL